MRTSTAAWTAALAVMSMHGPFTTAEAAPARQEDPERPRYLFPKHLRRGYNHSAPALETSSSPPVESESSSTDVSSSQDPITHYSQPLPETDTSFSSIHSRRSRSSTKTAPDYDEQSLIDSLISAGVLPETENTVVTTTLTLAEKKHEEATYTITYTETSWPAGYTSSSSSSSSVPLLTSSSVPLSSSSIATGYSSSSSSSSSIPVPTSSSIPLSSSSIATGYSSSSSSSSSIPVLTSSSVPLSSSSLPTGYSSSSSTSSVPLPVSSSLPTTSSSITGSSSAYVYGDSSDSSSGQATISSRGTHTHHHSESLSSVESAAAISSSATSKSHEQTDSKTLHLYNTSSSYHLLPTGLPPLSDSSSLSVPASTSAAPYSSVAPSSSSVVPSSSSSDLLGGVHGLTSSIGLLPTDSATSSTQAYDTKEPHGTGNHHGHEHVPPTSSTASSSDGLLGGLGLSSNLLNPTGHYGTGNHHDHQHVPPTSTAASSSDGILGGLSLSSNLLNPTGHHGTGNHHDHQHTLPTSSAAPSSDGLFGGLSLSSNLLNPTGHHGTGHRHSSSSQPSYPASNFFSSLIPTQLGGTRTRVYGTHGTLGGTGNILSSVQPLPTGHHQGTKSAIVDSSSSTDGGIIVGLSTILSNTVLPIGTHHRYPNPETTSGVSSELAGLTGISTGILPSQSILPTGIIGGGHKRPHGSDDGQSSETGGLLGSVTGGLTSATSGIVYSGTGVGGTLTNGAESKATGVAGTLTSAVGTGESKATGLAGTLTSAVGTGESKATGLAGTVTTAAGSIVGTTSDVVASVGAQGSTEVSAVVGTLTHAVGTGGTISNHFTGVAGTLTSAAGTATNAAGTATNAVGTAGTEFSTVVTNAEGTVTTKLTFASGQTIPISTPAGGYTITGGGVTLTIPIPSSADGPNPVTTSTGGLTLTDTTSTKPIITVSTGYSGILSSQPGTKSSDDTVTQSASAAPTYSETSVAAGTGYTQSASVAPTHSETSVAPGTGYTKSTSIALTGGTTLPLGSSSASPSTYPPATESSAATAAPTSTTTDHSRAPETIKPTGTDTYSTLHLPTSWTFAPTSNWGTKTKSKGLSTAHGSDTASGALPTYMPKLVQPARGMPDPPKNSTLIQLGFNYGLNYYFVVSHSESASQIFTYLPQGLAFGLGIEPHHIKMNALMPFDTSATLNYITTLAQVYVPSSLVETIEMSLHMPLSEMYRNPNSPVKTLMGMINPTIPLIPGASMDGSSSSAWWNPASTNSPTSQDGAPIGGDSGSSNHVRGSSVGIGVGAVCGAAVYAAAMVYVARRYRRNRQGHRRASSVHTSGEMSQRSGGMAGMFMSGANGRGSAAGSAGRGSRASGGSSNGRSVREQGISAPMMAENSLGWN